MTGFNTVIAMFIVALVGSFFGNLLFLLVTDRRVDERKEVPSEAPTDGTVSTRYQDEALYLTPDKRFFSNRTHTSDDDDDEEHRNGGK